MQGKYTQFDVSPSDFAVYGQAFTGAPNELDQTGGHFIEIYASKVPDHRGLSLTSPISVQISGTDITLSTDGARPVHEACRRRTARTAASSRWSRSAVTAPVTRIVHTSRRGVRTTTTTRTSGRRLGQFLGSGCTSTQTGPAGQFCVQVHAAGQHRQRRLARLRGPRPPRSPTRPLPGTTSARHNQVRGRWSLSGHLAAPALGDRRGEVPPLTPTWSSWAPWWSTTVRATIGSPATQVARTTP